MRPKLPILGWTVLLAVFVSAFALTAASSAPVPPSQSSEGEAAARAGRMAGLEFPAGGGRVSDPEGCTVIGVGRGATVDGSVITSHTDCCSECRIQVVPGRTFPKGAEAPVHWGMVYFGASDDRRPLPLGDFGKVIGRIPQVERTFTYFHTGYSQMNEKQLAIGESTCSQRPELDVVFIDGLTRQIMTVEQAQVFALERCSSAREAVKLIGGLVERYGFLPSCGGSEALCIADPRELWEMEICGVGPDWTPEIGKPGAIWAARRVPDDHAIVIANYFRIREIDPEDPDTLVSPNYMSEAVGRGWYDPQSGRPFVWQEAYAPPAREGNLSRMWLITSTLAPTLKKWPKRSLTDVAGPGTLYSQEVEGAAFYPYSFKPEKKVSVRDVIAFQRSVFEDTIYDMTRDPAWMVPGGGGKLVKSPAASPFVSSDLERVMRIRHHRTIATQGYGMVAQLRSWLPDAVGGIYWFYVDNPFVSPYVPVYAGVTDVSPLYKTYDFFAFGEDSARWAVDFVEKLMLLRWQAAVKDLREARDPAENGFFDEQASVDAEAVARSKTSPAAAAKYLTDLTVSRMERLVKIYRELRLKLLTKYTGDGV
jgi:dipeptidase